MSLSGSVLVDLLSDFLLCL